MIFGFTCGVVSALTNPPAITFRRMLRNVVYVRHGSYLARPRRLASGNRSAIRHSSVVTRRCRKPPTIICRRFISAPSPSPSAFACRRMSPTGRELPSGAACRALCPTSWSHLFFPGQPSCHFLGSNSPRFLDCVPRGLVCLKLIRMISTSMSYRRPRRFPASMVSPVPRRY